MEVLYARIDPPSVNLEKTEGGYIDRETGQVVRLPVPTYDQETGCLTSSTPQILQERFGVPIAEAVYDLPAGQDISVTEWIERGELDLTIPRREIALQVQAALERRMTPNGKLWSVTVAHHGEQGRSPAGGGYAAYGEEPDRRQREPQTVGTGPHLRPRGQQLAA